MKVIVYMAITANGMIATSDGNSDWVSEEDSKSFVATCRRAGAVIMGKHTYDVLAPNDLPLKKGLQIVWTHDKSLISDNPTVLFTNKSPKAIVELLKGKKYKKVCVIGGQQTVTEFMKDKLVDEIYLDVEPLLFGRGMPLFALADFEYKLKLLEIKKLNASTVQLHYEIRK